MLRKALVVIFPLDTILRFLYDHIDKSADNQARVKWRPYTIVLWDNRITAHVRLPLLPDVNLKRVLI